jgi:hypothetical protein
MTLERAGVAMAVAGVVAAAIHAGIYPGVVQRRSDCDAWRRARAVIARGAPAEAIVPATAYWSRRALWDALDDPDITSVWQAREILGRHPHLVVELLPALRDPTEIGLRNGADVLVWGRDIPFWGHRLSVSDDLFRRAGRASWLLKQATAHPARIVGVQTDSLSLAPLAGEWERWLDGLDGGDACGPFS